MLNCQGTLEVFDPAGFRACPVLRFAMGSTAWSAAPVLAAKRAFGKVLFAACAMSGTPFCGILLVECRIVRIVTFESFFQQSI